MKLLFFLFLIIPCLSWSQSMVIDNQASILQINSDTPKGILIPRMTEVQKLNISNAVKGLLVYQTDGVKGIYQFNGDNWISVGSNGPEYQAGNGIKIENDGSMSLYFPGQEAGDMFYFNGNNWVIIPKGENGQKLKIVNGVPTWID